MATGKENNIARGKRIVVQENGPYVVEGGIPLVHKAQVVSEHGEPLTWKTVGVIETDQTYLLCRCGHTSERPFCDGTHAETDFDGTESADTGVTADRQAIFPGATHIVVKSDPSLCMLSGFCGTRYASIAQMIPQTADTSVRSLVMAMIERCPSGSLTYSIKPGEPDIEPDLPRQVAMTTEITSEGPIAGPLWVTGNIAIERADGKPLEIRNRVTLCSCGHSAIKPLCDGTHRRMGIKETRRP